MLQGRTKVLKKVKARDHLLALLFARPAGSGAWWETELCRERFRGGPGLTGMSGRPLIPPAPANTQGQAVLRGRLSRLFGKVRLEEDNPAVYPGPEPTFSGKLQTAEPANAGLCRSMSGRAVFLAAGGGARPRMMPGHDTFLPVWGIPTAKPHDRKAIGTAGPASGLRRAP
jgi:hypothetical protein